MSAVPDNSGFMFRIAVFFVIIMGSKWIKKPYSINEESIVEISTKKIRSLAARVLILWPSKKLVSKV